jgi:hypothetical protein
MQLIRDNLTLWTSELEEDGDKWEWSFRPIYKAIHLLFHQASHRKLVPSHNKSKAYKEQVSNET